MFCTTEASGSLDFGNPDLIEQFSGQLAVVCGRRLLGVCPSLDQRGGRGCADASLALTSVRSRCNCALFSRPRGLQIGELSDRNSPLAAADDRRNGRPGKGI